MTVGALIEEMGTPSVQKETVAVLVFVYTEKGI
jgi:hypothetical protein